MKNLNSVDHVIGIVAALILINVSTLLSQSIDREVIAPAGQNFTTAAGSISYTLGETSTTTFDSGSELSQGFHQEWAVVTAVQNDFTDHFNINIYPNPTSGWLNVTSDIAVHLTLLDLSGKIVFQGEKEAGTVNIYIGDLAPGLYLLVMYDDAGKKATYKVQVVK